MLIFCSTLLSFLVSSSTGCEDFVEKFTGVHETINIKSKLMNKNITGLQIVSTPIGNLNDISQRASRND